MSDNQSTDESETEPDTQNESYQADLESIFTDPEAATGDTITDDYASTHADPSEPRSSSPSESVSASGDDRQPTDAATSTTDSALSESLGREQQSATGQSSDSPARSDAELSRLQWALSGMATVAGRVGQYAARKFWGRSNPKRGLSGIYYPNGTIGDEEVIFAENPSRWRSAGPYFIALSLLMFAIIIPLLIRYGPIIPYLNSRTPSFITIGTPSLKLLLIISSMLLAVAGGLVFIEALRRASKWLILTESKVIHRNRILDTNISEIRLQDINKTQTLEPFPHKLVNVGDIKLYTASTDEFELKFAKVGNPKNRNGLIEKTRLDLVDDDSEK